jgi:endonuclease/exonuclease/phosphatase (EEP) superfamily protein YafD
MLLILFPMTVLICVCTLLPLVRHPHWLVRGLDFPRLQIGCLAGLLGLGHVLLLDLDAVSTWALLTITMMCLTWQFWWVLPYTLLWSKEVIDSTDSDPDCELTILTSNVLTPNRNAKALIELVKRHKPDILVTMESDRWWEDKLKAIESQMPYSVKCPLDNLYGMHVFSRLPLIDSQISYLVEDDVPSIHALVKMRSNDEVRLHFVHPAPPSPTENLESSERDAELIVVARSVAQSRQPVIVTGDLNDVAWSSTTRLFRKISGLLDPRIGRGMFNTFHAGYWFLRWPLDHLFHSAHFQLGHMERLPPIGSDHFPLLTSLTLDRRHCAGQNGLSADASDRVWAEEIVQNKGVSKKDVPQPGGRT